MSQGERPPFLDKRLGERVAQRASTDMRQRVEKELDLNVPLPAALPEEVAPVTEPAIPIPVTGDDVHTRSPEVSKPSEPTSQDDQDGQALKGRRRVKREVKKAVAPAPEAKVEPVAVAVSADNPDEAAEIERLVQEAAAAEAAIAKESASDPIVADAQAPGEVAPRHHALPLEPVAEEPDKDAGSIPAPVFVPEVLAPVQEAEKKDVKGYEFRVLKNGEEQQYLAGDDTLFIVRKQKDGYYFVDGDGELSGPVTQDVMRHQAEAEGWRMIEQDPVAPKEETKPEASLEAEPAPVVVAAEAKEKDAEKMDLQQKIDALKTEVAEFRYKYAEMDYEKTSAWKTLKGFFRNMTPNGQEDADTQYWNSEYRSKLSELQEKELEQIKQSGLKGEALKERMAGLLQYYKYEQAAALYNDRTQVRMDRQGFIGKAWGKWEQAVRAYGKLSLSKKVLIGIGLAGFSVATGGVGGAGVLLLRRAMSATGLAMATDAALAALLDKKEQEKQAKDLRKEMDQLMDPAFVSSPEERLSGLLDEAIGGLNQKLQRKKFVALVRKEVSLNVGILGMAGGSLAAQAISDHWGTSSGTEGAPASSVGAASAPDAASSAPVSGAVEPAIGSVPSDEVATARANAEPAGAAGTDIQGFKVEFERYQVTDADGKRGLWGILEQHLPEDMLPQTEKNRIIQSLENIIQQKLDHMSAAELKEVGFPKGNVGQIYAGTEIDLGKLLTPDEIQAVMEGKDVASPHLSAAKEALIPQSSAPVSGVEASASSAKPPLGSPVSDTNGPQSIHKGPPVLGQDHRLPASSVEQLSVTESDPKTYLQKHPESWTRYNGILGRIRMNIFTLKAEHIPMEYDYAQNGEVLGKTQVTQVLRDMDRFDNALVRTPEANSITNPIQQAIAEQAKDLRGSNTGFFGSLNYDRIKNPLHYDQMRDVVGFVQASVKAFGPELARIQDGETINRYTQRMAVLALDRGKEIQGYYKP